MSKGVLIFAFDSTFCYTKLAELAAVKAKHHLGLPVTLVTNKPFTSPVFDSVVLDQSVEEQYRTFKDGVDLQTVKWLNTNRFDAYSITPYDQTLVIDADYFMFNNSLLKLFDTDLEFACYNDVFDITDEDRLLRDSRLHKISIPMQWATVMYFTKNKLAENIFSFMEHIKKHYAYYARLYHFSESVYRNDFALSIALQALTGYNTSCFTKIPGRLFTVDTSVKLIDIDFNKEHVVYQTRGKVCKIHNENLHIMNKNDLATFVGRHYAKS